ncbi:hypothetical protein KSP40_PGU022411 [Platanthera guangdongensis]|uniref:Uncharacterized protein n=1 Tax=Platanthera guangdongensis TaxID=2320717 RepID=A0ABR2N5N6_9ASPA
MKQHRGRAVEEEMEVEEDENDNGDGKLVSFEGGEHLTLDDVLPPVRFWRGRTMELCTKRSWPIVAT